MKQIFRSFMGLVVLVLVFVQSGHAEIEVMLENPAPDQKVSGIGVVSGWVFSTVPGAKVTVRLRIDGQDRGVIPCCVDRGDVAQLHGEQARNSGFGQVFNFNLLSNDTHTFQVEVTDDQGGTKSSPEHTVTLVKPGGFEVLSTLSVLLVNDIDRDGQEIILRGVLANEKGTNIQQEVTLRLAWQTNTQSLGIVDSDNTGSQTPAQTTQTEQTQSVSTQAGQATAGQIQAQSDSTISANLENPPNARTVSGLGIVSGWALASTSGATISSVQLRIDGQPSGDDIPCCSQRADVAQAFPDRPEAETLNSGFGAPRNFNLLPTGAHSIGVEVQDSTGASHIIDHQVTAVRLGDFEFIDQFDISEAELSVQGEFLVVENVKVRDKATQTIRTISTLFAWQASCQCFVAQSACGNGSVEPTEECDGDALAGETCNSLGFSGGSLSCRVETCELETKECTGGPRLYVVNLKDGTVSVINTATNTVEGQPIKVGDDPRGIAISPDGTSAYVTNFKDDTVSVIDIATNTVPTTIDLQQANEEKGPQGVAFAPDGTKVYVVNGFDNSVSVIDTGTKEVVNTIPVGTEPQQIAISPDGTRAYVTNFAENSVSVIDLATNGVIATVPVGETPNGIAVSRDGKHVYVANYNFDVVVGGDTVSIIDTATNATVGDPLSVGFHPAKVVFSPDGTRAYVTSFLNDTVAVIDTSVPSVLTGIATFDHPDGVVVGLQGKRVYVALYGRDGNGSFVEVISPISNGTIAFVEVGDGPFAVALTPFSSP